MTIKISDSDFIYAVSQAKSIRQLLGLLGLKQAGGNYSTTQKRIKLLNLDTSHFHGQLWNKGKTIGPKRPIEDYLSNKYSIQSFKLNKRLIREKIFEHQCSSCNLREWQGKPIPIELDHIDGNHSNNNLSNLRLLCPNCHAQTDNYRGKNIGK